MEFFSELRFEVKAVEGLEEDVGDEVDQAKSEDGVWVVMEAMVKGEIVDEVVESLVFNVPTGVSDSADSIGGGLFLVQGSEPEPVGGFAVLSGDFGFMGSDDANGFGGLRPGGKSLQVPTGKLFISLG